MCVTCSGLCTAEAKPIVSNPANAIGGLPILREQSVNSTLSLMSGAKTVPLSEAPLFHARIQCNPQIDKLRRICRRSN